MSQLTERRTSESMMRRHFGEWLPRILSRVKSSKTAYGCHRLDYRGKRVGLALLVGGKLVPDDEFLEWASDKFLLDFRAGRTRDP